MSHRAGIRACWAALIFLSLCSRLLLAQDNLQNSQASQNPTVTHPLLVNVTGCLKKSAETGGYYVSDQKGRTWALTSKKMDLAKYVSHTVSLSGHPSSGAKTQEGKNEKQFDLDVTELKMVSNSCRRSSADHPR